MHIADIMQNSIHAGCSKLILTVGFTGEDEYLEIKIEDDGRGMSGEEREKAADPFYTSGETREVGLGISLFKAAAEAAEGRLELFSREGRGTGITGVFKNRSLDRQPLGSIGNVMFLHMLSYPHIRFLLHICRGEMSYIFDSRHWIREQEDAGATATDAAFLAEDVIDKQVRCILGSALPELGGVLDAIK